MRGRSAIRLRGRFARVFVDLWRWKNFPAQREREAWLGLVDLGRRCLYSAGVTNASRPEVEVQWRGQITCRTCLNTTRSREFAHSCKATFRIITMSCKVVRSTARQKKSIEKERGENQRHGLSFRLVWTFATIGERERDMGRWSVVQEESKQDGPYRTAAPIRPLRFRRRFE